MSNISAGTTVGTALVNEGNTDGTLVLRTNGTTTAVTIGTDQSATFAGQGVFQSGADVTGETLLRGNAEVRGGLYENQQGLTGTSLTIDAATGNVFSLTTSGATTFNAVTNVPVSGTAYGFILHITAGGTHTVDYSGLGTNVRWAGGTAPDAPATGETDVLGFLTYDGGTNWYGFLAGDAMA